MNNNTVRAAQRVVSDVAVEMRRAKALVVPVTSAVFATAEILVAAFITAGLFIEELFFGSALRRVLPSKEITVYGMKRQSRITMFSIAASLIGATFATGASAYSDSVGFSADAAARWAISTSVEVDAEALASSELDTSGEEVVSERLPELPESTVVAEPTEVQPEKLPELPESDVEPAALVGLQTLIDDAVETVEVEPVEVEVYEYSQISREDASEIIGRNIPWALYAATEKAVRTYDRHYADREDYAGCGITVEFLLATAYEESGQWWGRIGGDGTMYPALINGSDARGPFQFTGEAWQYWMHDANGDNFRDAQNAYDAAGASMRYHCRLAVATYGGSLLDPVVAWNVAADYHDGPGRDRSISVRCVAGTADQDWCYGENYASRRLSLYSELMGFNFDEITPESANSVERL